MTGISLHVRGLLLASLSVVSLPAHADDFAALRGFWQCSEQGEGYTLEFTSPGVMLYNGIRLNYQLGPNLMLVEEQYGPVPYYYELQGDRLNFPALDGTVARCQRAKRPAPAPAPQQPPSVSGSHSAQAVVPGRNWPVYARPAGRVAWDTTDPQALVYKFAARWDHASRNTLSNIYLKPDGRYEDAYEAGYSGNLDGPGGGAWGATGAEQAGGYWTIEGTLERGVITLHRHNGTREVLNYQVYTRNGEYFGDYYFNGKLYTPKYIYR